MPNISQALYFDSQPCLDKSFQHGVASYFQCNLLPLLPLSTYFFCPSNYLLQINLNIFQIYQIQTHINLVNICHILTYFKHHMPKANIFINLKNVSKVQCCSHSFKLVAFIFHKSNQMVN
jgi:hypothetical protein